MRPVQLPLAPIPPKPTPSLKRKWPGRWSPLEILVGRKINYCVISPRHCGEVHHATLLVETKFPRAFVYQSSIYEHGVWSHVFTPLNEGLPLTRDHSMPSRRCTVKFVPAELRISARRGWCPPLDDVLSAIHGATWTNYRHDRGLYTSLREPVPQWWFIPSYDNNDNDPPF